MNHWHRVFAAQAEAPTPADLATWLTNVCPNVEPHFHGDDLGWFRVDIQQRDKVTTIEIERYLTREDGIRSELNNWAAWLESLGDHGPGLALMPRIIGSEQLFTIRSLSEDARNDDDISAKICRWLAKLTSGVYQVEGRGFFSADGELLVAE